MEVQKPEPMIRAFELLKSGMLPFSEPTLWRKVKEGSFPQPIRIGRITAWKQSQIAAWQNGEYVAEVRA
ncbi:AlpA family phage regulatory protein [Bradyrhizobium sp. CNPSo 4016]|nr:AlpA family phage regulatory protein [Bradyrhizobium glycinis]